MEFEKQTNNEMVRPVDPRIRGQETIGNETYDIAIFGLDTATNWSWKTWEVIRSSDGFRAHGSERPYEEEERDDIGAKAMYERVVRTLRELATASGVAG